LSEHSRSSRAANGQARFWAETGLAGLSAALFLLTLVRRDWIETVLGVDLDHRSGGLEWIVAAALLLVSLGLGALARSERRRCPVA
jgi:hypothetical protein